MKIAIAVLIGVVLAVIVIFGVETFSHAVFPPPEGLNPNDPESIRALMDQAPVGAKLMVILAYALGAFAGGLGATYYIRSEDKTPMFAVSAILEVLVILNLVMVPHPVWFMILAIAVVLPCAWLGYLFTRKKLARE